MENQTNPSKEVKRTWGAKIPHDLREMIENITEATGMKGEELLTNLVESFDLNQTKLAAPKFEKDIDNLESYTAGIVSCIKNIIETATDMEKINEEKYQKKIKDKENELIKIKEDFDKLKKSNEVLNDEIMDYWTKNGKLEEDLQIFKESAEERTVKNKEIMDLKDTVILERNEKIKNLNELIVNLTSEVEKNKKYQEEILSLKEDIDLVEQKLVDKINKIKVREIEINGLTLQIEFFKDQIEIRRSEYKTEINELKSSMKQDFDDRVKKLEQTLEKVKSKKDEEIKNLKKLLEEPKKRD